MLTSTQLSRVELKALSRVVDHVQCMVETLQEELPLDDVDVCGALEDFQHGLEKLKSFHERQGQQ